jgi:hypothetical protein
VFFLANNTWVNLQGIQQNISTPAARSHSVYGVIERENDYDVFVIAYGAGGSSDYNDVWTLDLNTWMWYQLDPQGTKPESRYGMFGGVFHIGSNEFWIGGGFTTLTSNPLVYRPNIDIHRLTFSGPQSASWEKLYDNPSPGNQYNPFVPHGRGYAASAVVTADKLVIFGGCLSGGTGGGPCPAGDIWTFDEKSSGWTQMVSCPSPRLAAVMVSIPGLTDHVILHGGTHGTNQIIGISDYPASEVYILDINGAADKQWKRYQTRGDGGLFPGRRYNHAMAAGDNGTVYLFGGASVGPNEYQRDLWRLSGSIENTGEIAQTCENVQFTFRHLHGLFMSIAFAILLPVGFLIARYYRTKGRVWFVLHIICQLTAVMFAVIGFIIIFATSYNPTPLYPHGIIGLVIMFVLLLQVLNGIARPRVKRERKKKSVYRVFWEFYHKISGLFTIILGFIQITLGLFLVIPPLVVWAVWIGIFGLWMIAFLLHEIVKWIRYCVERRSKPRRTPKSKPNLLEFDMNTY